MASHSRDPPPPQVDDVIYGRPLSLATGGRHTLMIIALEVGLFNLTIITENSKPNSHGNLETTT